MKVRFVKPDGSLIYAHELPGRPKQITFRPDDSVPPEAWEHNSPILDDTNCIDIHVEPEEF